MVCLSAQAYRRIMQSTSWRMAIALPPLPATLSSLATPCSGRTRASGLLLTRLLRSNKLFQLTSTKAQLVLAQALKLKRLRAGEMLYLQADAVQSAYLCVSGSLSEHVYTPPNKSVMAHEQAVDFSKEKRCLWKRLPSIGALSKVIAASGNGGTWPKSD